MSTNIKKMPFPVTYRELWLPEGINTDVTLPTAPPKGHGLTLQGAQKGTTCDGVHLTGGATSNIVIVDNAIQNSQQAFHITIRFKLDTTFDATAPADFVLFKKTEGVNDWLKIFLENADGRLHFDHRIGIGMVFQLASATNSWLAGVWYTVTCELTSTPTQRMIVNGVEEDAHTDAAQPTPASGAMVLFSSADGDADGIVGTVSWVVIGVGATATVALTVLEEGYLNAGIPPVTAKVQYMLLLDEGRGVTATNRGSAGAGGNGTLDSACTWKFGAVRQPCLSLDSINDYAVSSSGVDISGAITLVWAGKMKSTYASTAIDRDLIELFIDNTNLYGLYYNLLTNDLDWHKITGGGSDKASGVLAPTIDEYKILIATATVAGVLALYSNGVLLDTGTWAAPMPALAAVAYIGAEDSPANFDISKPLFIGLIEGAFTAAQAKTYSRWLNAKLGLGLTI